jgi:hypothetical protein
LNNTAEVFRRIANIQAELAALMRVLGGEEPTVSVVAEVSTPVAVVARAPELGRKVRWRYLPGTWYKIVGRNPFRNGNNYNLFEYLTHRYGDGAWSREELGEALRFLSASGRFRSMQTEDNIVLVFLRTAGPEKGAIEMSAPRPGAIQADFSVVSAAVSDDAELAVAAAVVAAAPPSKATQGAKAAKAAKSEKGAKSEKAEKAASPAKAPRAEASPAVARPPLRVVEDDELPAEPGDDRFQLLGEMPFRTGVNTFIWQRLGNDVFARSEITTVVTDLVAQKAFESIRPVETIVRDFLGRVQEKGRLKRF